MKNYNILLKVADDGKPEPFTKEQIKEWLESAINESGVTVDVIAIEEKHLIPVGKVDAMMEKLYNSCYHGHIAPDWWFKLAEFVVAEKDVSYRDGLITGSTPDARCPVGATNIPCDEPECSNNASFVLDKRTLCITHAGRGSDRPSTDD